MTLDPRSIDTSQLPVIGGPDAFARHFDVPPATIDRLKIYVATLELWQRRINLVAPATLPEVWHRHIADSAQILALAPASLAGTWIDLGSGAGFPGLVAAILLAEVDARPERFVLIESDQRKCAFLGEVVRKTELAKRISVDIVTARIESSATQSRVGTGLVVSARALASLDKLLELASPYLGSASRCLFLKGRGAEAELTAARKRFVFSHARVPSRTEPEASIIVVDGKVLEVED